MCTLVMAASSSGAGGVTATVTCPTCDHTVPQAPGTKRTICPNCGNFYDRESAERPPSYRRTRQSNPARLPNLRDNPDNGKSKGGSRLQSIANFFQNLGPVRSSSSNNSQERRPSAGSNTGVKSELPPIADEKNLTNAKKKPSYLPLPSAGPTPHSSPLGSPKNDPPGPDKPPRSPGPAETIQTNHLKNATAEQLRREVKQCCESGLWRSLHDFYAMTFDSFIELNAAFKIDPSQEYKTVEEPGIKFDYVGDIYHILLSLPNNIQKEVLKAIINNLLKDKRPHSKDDLRAYLILLQNPQFTSQSTYIIFAHLLRQIAALSDHDHHFLVHWIRKMKPSVVKAVLDRLHNFISVRLFPPKPQDLPPLSKCTWWIPSATKVMALFNASNNMFTPMVSYIDFYNSSLDHLDLMAEYYAWQNPNSHSGFSFCQYPFILSIAAKRSILQKDSEQQMIVMARKSLVAKVQRRQLPDIGMLFLNLTIRRSHLVSDSLHEIARKQQDLKKKLKVTFSGEPGLDMGGLTKEWFLLLIRRIFQTDYGMFTYNKTSGVYWFSSFPCDNYQEFNLVGVLMGLAVYNSINLDLHFPPSCYKKLLSPAVVPFNNPRATVGVAPVSLLDLNMIQPDVAKGLQNLLDYDGSVEDDFGLTFQISQSEFGGLKTIPLKPGGENIPVSNENRKEYVQLYVDWVLNRSVYAQFQAFYHGFHSVCASNALIMLRPEEVEMLVCGSPTLDMSELKKVTSYDGYTAQDHTVKFFWDVVLAWSPDLQKKLLLFTTGSDRVPVGGMAEMSFKITRVSGQELLPMAHTCFNQLVLPAYKSKRILKQKLTAAIQNTEGFGLE
ncbi:probable E3 ubiquitin-protein ligase HECTD2 isoform X2 [Gigantopelta aegis]|uniref:probable E3 ubiquitin-protein ligase HECTD2 isoform X2 n=1 Tax=Gigantopelta aegis TaxID=1735272 RepID=UPI001B88E191|nr:probable E3 ubiquitin-protein ligase HECTD2 isoform X2 [Gigantopelta aegis]